MSSEEKLLIKFIGFFAFTTSLAQIFLNVYLFKLGGFRSVVEYGLTSLIFLFIFYILSGYLLKAYSQIALVRIGVLLLGLSYFLLFILRENSIDYILIIGAINGIGNGNFWSGFNLSQYIATHTKSRNEYFGKQNFTINVGSASGPVVGGVVIFLFSMINDKTLGYSFLFLIVSILFFYLFVTIRATQRHIGADFAIKDILKHRRSVNWKIVLSQQFLYGLYDISLNTFSAVLIFLIVSQEINLGIVNTTSAVTYALASLLAIKLLNKNKNAYAAGSIFCFLCLLVFGLTQNIIGIISLILLYYVFIPLLFIPTNRLIYDVIDDVKEDWKTKYHFLIERDSAIGAGRITSYLILLFFLDRLNDPQIAKNWMLIIPIFPLIIGLLQFFYYKNTKN